MLSSGRAYRDTKHVDERASKQTGGIELGFFPICLILLFVYFWEMLENDNSKFMEFLLSNLVFFWHRN